MTAGSKQAQRTIYFNAETDNDILEWLYRQSTSISDAVKSALRERMKDEPETIRREIEQNETRNEYLRSILPAAETRVVRHAHPKELYLTKEKIIEVLMLSQIPQGDRDLIFFWEVFRRVGKGDRDGLLAWANPGWKEVVRHVGFKNMDAFLDEVFAAYKTLLDDPEMSKQIPDWLVRKAH